MQQPIASSSTDHVQPIQVHVIDSRYVTTDTNGHISILLCVWEDDQREYTQTNQDHMLTQRVFNQNEKEHICKLGLTACPGRLTIQPTVFKEILSIYQVAKMQR
jgi:D-Tyr-tRNAtyr deacylase